MDPTDRGRSLAGTLQHKAFVNSRSPSAHSFHDASATLDPAFLQNTQPQNTESFGDLNGAFDLSSFDNQSADTSFFSHAPSQFDDSDIAAINGTDISPFIDPSIFSDAGNQLLNTSNMATMHEQVPQSSQFFGQNYQQPQSNGLHMGHNVAQNNSDGSVGYQQDPRRTSLDPSAAYAISANGAWNGDAFKQYQHRRTPSDISDISSSAHPSPNLGEMDSFDNGAHSNYHSPLLQPTDPSMQNSFGLEQFSIGTDMGSMPGPSPGHSPHISPNLQPQTHGLESFQAADFNMLGNVNNHNYQGNMMGANMFSQQDMEAFPTMGSTGGSPGLEQNGTMSPPIINVVSAEDRQPAMGQGLSHRNSVGALSPPLRSYGGRHRTVSDTSHSRGSSRSPSPSGRPRTPSLGDGQATLGPLQAQPSSRSPSPTPNPNGVVKNRRYSSPDRGRVLEMADPSRSASNGSSGSSFVGEQSTGSDTNRRVQKHPAIFSCHLCTKRFTRAYNLRSHLRTHTDERPFVCSVCGKAFARQHDRKRHEGLHTGEKKFVCRGNCSSADGGQMQWGCGRRFARADALGRHFRSEAGRACIKPLMDEEARERQQDQMEQAEQGFVDADMFGNPSQQIINSQSAQHPQQIPQVSFNGMPLPAALLQQYPALAEIQWNQIPGPGGVGAGDENDDYGASPRSSFENSEFEEDGEYHSGEAEHFGGQSSTQWIG